MKSWIAAALLVMTACKPRETEAGLVAKVKIDPNLVSKCMQLEIGANGSRRNSNPVLLAGKSVVFVGIAQGTFPDQVEVRALGYADEGCQTRAREESLLVSATFDKKAVREVMLTLKKVLPKTETECSDGRDDDEDGTKDCEDSDCNDKPCTSSALCLVSTRCSSGSCGGGEMKACLTPPSTCFQPSGSCSPNDGTCRYSVAMAAQCDDNDVCTTQDKCELDGGCRGAPVSCVQSGNVCLEGVGNCADGGCTFAPKIDAGCDDSDSCTITDRCSAQGTCSGSRVSCQPTSCRSFTNQCNADGGCIFAMVDAGTSCDGGLCTLAGDCLPRFPYQPVNFDITDLRAPPPMPTVLDCGETTIDTSATGNMRLDNWCRGQPFEATVLRQANGPEVLLVSMSGLTISNDAGLTIVGSRPIIFAVFGDVDITGQIVTRAGAPLCTAGNGNDGASEALGNSGGSGAGFSTAGGQGGAGSFTSTTSAGGAEPQVGPTPLRGGCRGGRGGDQSGAGAEGGGAVQISAGGTMSINGVIAAPGRGGARGTYQLVKGKAGNGGGSGGMVVLEATTLVISGGAVTANGGGGGEGGGIVIGADGNAGADGALASSTPASGGSGGATVGGEGGQGGALGPPTAGTASTSGGGGGGSSGRLFFRGPGSCSIGPQVILSPAPALDAGCP
ncbi:MAG: hypothetical protein GQE15_23125 [Archangiaceae bacterium]|nr:hypothetical protein [Archangiaceae bacterium]